MKTLFLIIAVVFSTVSDGQTTYKVKPGSKENQIKLSVSNSSESPVQNVNVWLSKKSSSLNFKTESRTVELIEQDKEQDITFKFDINRYAPINTEDTIEFMITYGKGNAIRKSFILNYTAPKDYKLEQNFPNPFNPATTIQYQLPMDGKVTLKVYDILGSEITTLVNEFQQAGFKEVKFDASSLASGIYIYRLAADKYISTKKMMMIK